MSSSSPRIKKRGGTGNTAKKKVKQEKEDAIESNRLIYDTKQAARSASVADSPPKFELQWALLNRMRRELDAPVDRMGVEQIHDKSASDKEQRFHNLVSLLLSSQTKDPVTYAAVESLLKLGLTVENIASDNVSIEDIDSHISKVGFHNRKSQYLKDMAILLKEEFDGDTPNNIDDLLRIRGIGPKMGYLHLLCAWKIVKGIGTDTHVHRASNRLGWTLSKKTKQPEQTRLVLESWLPKKHWATVNLLLVGFGQTICTPLNPSCSKCLLAKYSACPSAFREGTHEKRPKSWIKGDIVKIEDIEDLQFPL